MATPQIPGGKCEHCRAPLIDLFAEWTDEYQSAAGKQLILAGGIVFDCYHCRQPLQLALPLALIVPHKLPDQYQIAVRRKSRCEAWLVSQHPGQSLSQIVEAAGWQHNGQWAFDGYVWAEGGTHRHGQDAPPGTQGAKP
jgi:hypothetical protein